jgi:hypothetical protein
VRGRAQFTNSDRLFFIQLHVSVGPQGHDDHPARDPRAMASRWIAGSIWRRGPCHPAPLNPRRRRKWTLPKSSSSSSWLPSFIGSAGGAGGDLMLPPGRCVCRKPGPFDLVKESRTVGHDGCAAPLPFEAVGFAVQADQPA